MTKTFRQTIAKSAWPSPPSAGTLADAKVAVRLKRRRGQNFLETQIQTDRQATQIQTDRQAT